MLRRLMTAAVLAAGLGAVACTAEVEDEGKLPDENLRGGELPKIDIDPANVNISTDTQTVIVPDVDVTPTEGADTAS